MSLTAWIRRFIPVQVDEPIFLKHGNLRVRCGDTIIEISEYRGNSGEARIGIRGGRSTDGGSFDGSIVIDPIASNQITVRGRIEGLDP